MGDLVELLAGEWGVWREVVVRATGFPVVGLDVFGEGEEARLVGLADEGRLREALTWQNREVLQNALDRLSSEASGSTRRRRLETVASYWQRYCAKNDTIGFFGPIGWGEIVDEGPAVVMHPGDELLKERTTRFEVWAIDTVAAVLAEDPEVRQWIPPRRHPGCVPADLDPAEQEVYDACDGRPAFEVGPLALIEKLVARGLLVWTFTVPLGPHPERDLRSQLESIGDPSIRQRCCEVLDRLEAGRNAVAASAGDAQALARALADLDQIFESLTATAPRRRAGEMYAGRTICYEDCRRDLDLRLGPAVVKELARALVPVLASSRWYCGEVFSAGSRLVSAALDEARTAGGSSTVRLLDVWRRAIPRLMLPQVRREMFTPFDGMDAVVAELQRRWTELLAGDLDLLAERAQTMFADARPAWPRAVFHGPDVQIAAANIDAINAGDFTVVVGDFHPGSAPVGQSLFLEGHRDPGGVRRFIADYLREPRLIVVPSRHIGRIGGRFTFGYGTRQDYFVLTTDETCMPQGHRCLALADLWVENVDGAAWITHDSTPIAPLTHAFEHLIFISGVQAYQPFTGSAYAPRITAGRTVLRRETWTIPAQELDWTNRKVGAHEAARAWASGLGMPRRVFALASGEPKPIYVDFSSRALTGILARHVRGAGDEGIVRFSEMLPSPDETWLIDAQGRRYTSELRLTVVDLRMAPAN